jgi:hypothetical protein
VWGLGCRVEGILRVAGVARVGPGLAFRVESLGIKVERLRCWVDGCGLEIWGLGF